MPILASSSPRHPSQTLLLALQASTFMTVVNRVKAAQSFRANFWFARKTAANLVKSFDLRKFFAIFFTFGSVFL
jgi:hypothetical protein